MVCVRRVRVRGAARKRGQHTKHRNDGASRARLLHRILPFAERRPRAPAPPTVAPLVGGSPTRGRKYIPRFGPHATGLTGSRRPSLADGEPAPKMKFSFDRRPRRAEIGTILALRTASCPHGNVPPMRASFPGSILAVGLFAASAHAQYGQ